MMNMDGGVPMANGGTYNRGTISVGATKIGMIPTAVTVGVAATVYTGGTLAVGAGGATTTALAGVGVNSTVAGIAGTATASAVVGMEVQTAIDLATTGEVNVKNTLIAGGASLATGGLASAVPVVPVSYTHLTLPTTPYV